MFAKSLPSLALVSFYTFSYAHGRVPDRSIPISAYTPTAIISADPTVSTVGSFASCSPIAKGAGPVPTPDTAEAFVAFSDFSQAANSAAVPSGYVNSFINLKGSAQTVGYLGYTTLDSYDVASCAAQCTAKNGCLSFNVYFERTPTVNPQSSCPNPSSSTTIKCALWGAPTTAQNAKNTGQWREGFHVVIAGSNGYVNSLIHDIPGYNVQALGNGAIHAPLDCNNTDTYLGYKLFNDGKPYDPARCAAACEEQTAYNVAHPPADGSAPKQCMFFNSYILNKNDVPQGQVCSMYSSAWPSYFATNYGQWQGNDRVTITWSFGFDNNSLPCNACLPAGAPKFNDVGEVIHV